MIPWILTLGLLSAPTGAPEARPTLSPEPAPRAAGSRLAIRAKHVLRPDGSLLENGVILIEDGRIQSVGADVDVPEGVRVVEHGGTVSPGLIAGRTFGGLSGGAVDKTRTFLPGAQVADAVDPDHSDFEKALHAGITTVVLSPLPETVAPGTTAVVKTAGARALKIDAHLALALAPSAFDSVRLPTSIGGAMRAIEERLAQDEGPFARVAAGELPVLIEVEWGSRPEQPSGPSFFFPPPPSAPDSAGDPEDSRAAVQRACALASRHGLKGALRGGSLAGEIAPTVKESGLAVVLGPYGPGTSERALRASASLAEAGVPLAFALDAPEHSPEALRMTAALCVRAGMDRGAALRALTSEAARIAGVGDRVGRLERGMDADLVLWSGHPLDLASVIEAVYVDGVRVHGGDQ